MALMLTCEHCGNQQLVSMVFNGRSHFVNPHEKCGGCGTRGGFGVPGADADSPIREAVGKAADDDRN